MWLQPQLETKIFTDSSNKDLLVMVTDSKERHSTRAHSHLVGPCITEQAGDECVS